MKPNRIWKRERRKGVRENELEEGKGEGRRERREEGWRGVRREVRKMGEMGKENERREPNAAE